MWLKNVIGKFAGIKAEQAEIGQKPLGCEATSCFMIIHCDYPLILLVTLVEHRPELFPCFPEAIVGNNMDSLREECTVVNVNIPRYCLGR